MKDATSRILKTAHRAAKALHRVGALDDITMREMDELCLAPAPSYSPTDIRRIRASTGMSQPVFARLLGVGKSAVAQWEQGEKKPGGPALRLLETFDTRASSPVLRVRQRQAEREATENAPRPSQRQAAQAAYAVG